MGKKNAYIILYPSKQLFVVALRYSANFFLKKAAMNEKDGFTSCMFFFLGGKLVYLYTKKPGATPKCGDCKDKLRGVS